MKKIVAIFSALLWLLSAPLAAQGIPGVGGSMIPNGGGSGGSGSSGITLPLNAGSTVLTQSNLNAYRVMIARAQSVQAGGPQFSGWIGDSTMCGVGIGTSGGSLANNAKLRTWPFTLAKTLTALGIPSRIGGVFGDGNMTQFTSYGLYDTRMVLGAGFISNSFQIPGGFAFTFTNVGGGGFNNASSTMSFTPSATDQFDTITIIWGQRGGTATVNVDGGSPLTVTAGLSVGLTTVALPNNLGVAFPSNSSFTVTKGTHTVNIVMQAGTTNDVYAIRTYDSTISYLDIMPICASGLTIGGFDSQGGAGFGQGHYLGTYMGMSEMIINLTVNDVANGTTGAAYTTTLNGLKQFNPQPWMFMLGPYIGGMGNPISGNQIVSAIVAFAAANNEPVIDYSTRWIGGAANLTGGDAVHPTYQGDNDIARFNAFLFSQM